MTNAHPILDDYRQIDLALFLADTAHRLEAQYRALTISGGTGATAPIVFIGRTVRVRNRSRLEWVMADIVTDIRHAIPEVGRIISAILASGQQPTPPKQKAIRAVWSAVDSTRMYIRMIENGQARAGAPNPELVALWSDASLQLAEVDPDLALRLRAKAEYWSDPEGWDDRKIDEARIGINAVAADARELLQLAMPQPPVPRRTGATDLDVFLSHASDDKEAVARPLAAELTARGRSVWLDELSLRVGDTLTSDIDRGLVRSKFGVVILSQSFIAKAWPRMELSGLVALETSDGRKAHFASPARTKPPGVGLVQPASGWSCQRFNRRGNSGGRSSHRRGDARIEDSDQVTMLPRAPLSCILRRRATGSRARSHGFARASALSAERCGRR